MPQFLKDHINAVHEGIKRFHCEHCGHSEYYKHAMRKHVEQVHEKLKPFQCQYCGTKFGDRGAYKYHHTRCGTNSLQRLHGKKQNQTT